MGTTQRNSGPPPRVDVGTRPMTLVSVRRPGRTHSHKSGHSTPIVTPGLLTVSTFRHLVDVLFLVTDGLY